MKEQDNELVCYCIEVTKQTIIDSIQRGNVTLSMIKQDTKACTGNRCKELNPSGKCCSGDIIELIQQYAQTSINHSSDFWCPNEDTPLPAIKTFKLK
jgi:NAD(P)H-nitrite reductase large subunit